MKSSIALCTLLLFLSFYALSQPPAPAPRENAHNEQKETASQKSKITQHNDPAQTPRAVVINQYYSQPSNREKSESGNEQQHGTSLELINTVGTVLLAVFTLI